MKASGSLRSSTVPAALGSLGSLGAQAAMALFLLGLFEPRAVGMFSVVAQIAFGWATLALAQSPISLLASQHLAALPAARQAWRHSLQRWWWLVPGAALAAWWSGPSGTDDPPALGWLTTLLWAAAIALMQMGWLLAQSLTLRLQASWSIAMVRLLPPVIAAALAAAAALVLDWRSEMALTTAALAGYAAGALWLLAAMFGPQGMSAPKADPSCTGDLRSDRLKFLHTLSDVLVTTLLAANWAAVYGAAQAGCLLILLRVMGFVPALVSTAWAQVLLGRPHTSQPSSALAATGGALAVLTLGLLIHLALVSGWLGDRWSALQAYLWPVAIWQMAAGVMAAVSHRPFQHRHAIRYSYQCLAMNTLQALLLLLPPWLGWPMQTHLWALAGFLCVALLLQSLWAARLGHADTGERP